MQMKVEQCFIIDSKWKSQISPMDKRDSSTYQSKRAIK